MRKCENAKMRFRQAGSLVYLRRAMAPKNQLANRCHDGIAHLRGA
ncbi:MAG: hypothetical protein ACI814_004972, partial [Mariniblastus sp.]